LKYKKDFKKIRSNGPNYEGGLKERVKGLFKKKKETVFEQ
jgi:hypothetical protein